MLLAGRPRRLVALLAGFLPALWLLVPVHELLHAAGCALTGGAVSRLEIEPLFGGALLARVFPWIVAGGEYAGRLSGFAPAGDLSYLAAVLLPHLALAPAGAALCRAAARRGRPALWGASFAAAAQPLASLFGDFYEAAAIPLTAAAQRLGAAWAPALRGDDVQLVWRRVAALGGPGPAVLFFAAALGGIGLALALLRVSGGVACRDGGAAELP